MPIEDPHHREIRAANICIEHSDDRGVAMTITAGKLRLRLYIDAQWNELVRKISVGHGELGEMVPFQMHPFHIPAQEITDGRFEVEERDGAIVSTRTIGAAVIPGLTEQDPLHDTPLWRGKYPPISSND